MDLIEFHQGDQVEKRAGYKFPGIVVSVLRTLAGETRLVVECTVPDIKGMLHIFSPEQMLLVKSAAAIHSEWRERQLSRGSDG